MVKKMSLAWPAFLALAILIAMALSGEARGQGYEVRQHFAPGEEVLVNTMMCDTVEQIEGILRAQTEQGLAAGRDVYQRLRETPNAMREPTCLVAPYRLTMLDTAAVIEDVLTLEGGRATVYILWVLVNNRPYVILSPMAIEPPGQEV